MSETYACTRCGTVRVDDYGCKVCGGETFGEPEEVAEALYEERQAEKERRLAEEAARLAEEEEGEEEEDGDEEEDGEEEDEEESEGGEEYECDECDQTFDSQQGLASHKRVH